MQHSTEKEIHAEEDDAEQIR